jgi:hypothetical protein
LEEEIAKEAGNDGSETTLRLKKIIISHEPWESWTGGPSGDDDTKVKKRDERPTSNGQKPTQ